MSTRRKEERKAVARAQRRLFWLQRWEARLSRAVWVVNLGVAVPVVAVVHLASGPLRIRLVMLYLVVSVPLLGLLTWVSSSAKLASHDTIEGWFLRGMALFCLTVTIMLLFILPQVWGS